MSAGLRAPYPGLPRATIDFLAGLAAANDRDWLAAHRDGYERDWKAAGLDLAAALVTPAAEIGLTVIPRLDASLRRLHRDTRFSADKRPFHTDLHLILSAGEPVGRRPGVHLVIGPAGFDFGVGEWALPPARLAAFRAAVLDEGRRAPLLRAIAAAEAAGCGFGPPDLARLPRGVAAPADLSADWAHLLRRKSFVLRARAPQPLPEVLFTPDAPAALAAVAARLAPVAHWLAALDG